MKESSQGIGIFGVLGIVFIVLKLAKVIAWSWWLVLAPFWIPLAFAIGVVFIGIAGWLIGASFR